MSERLQKLRAMLEKSPNDTFLLYAIALEHKKAGEFPEAIRWFDRVLQVDPAYAVAYHQAGLTHEAAGAPEMAKRAYHDGIAAAERKGDHHAADEMRAALDLIQ